MIRFGTAYSQWSNGINEPNDASCDLTIKKLMEDKKIGLTDFLVKTAAWTHNTNINRAGYTPLMLATGKAVTIPGLAMGNEGSYNAGDKLWYQYKDGNAWYGPAEVIYHKGNTIFIHGNGDVKKVAACKVKPYDLKDGEDKPRDKGEKSPETIEKENNDETDTETENNENNDETDATFF